MDKKLGKKSVKTLQKKLFWDSDSFIVKVLRVRKYYSNTGKVYSLITIYDSTSS